MDLYFVTDARFYKDTDGSIYAGEMSFNHNLYKRYLKVFDKIYIIARIFDGRNNLPKEHIVDNVEILPLPAFCDVWGFLRKYNEVKRLMKQYLENKKDAIIIRGVGGVGFLASQYCMKQNINYGMEVIGDPYDTFVKEVIKHPLRTLFRYLFTYFQKKAVYHASSAIYVTQYALQKRYPTKIGRPSFFASDVFIDDDDIFPKQILTDKNRLDIICVGELEDLRKSPDKCIHIIDEMNRRGIDTHLKWLGRGRYMERMRALTRKLAIEDKVQFLGSVQRDAVDKHLDSSDVFLLLSHSEGLPRAMVEAMSRGLPCVGTNIGGISELLDDEFIVPTRDIYKTCDILQNLLKSPKIYRQQSERNLMKAKKYTNKILDKKREEFYQTIKKKTYQNTNN